MSRKADVQRRAGMMGARWWMFAVPCTLNTALSVLYEAHAHGAAQLVVSPTAVMVRFTVGDERFPTALRFDGAQGQQVRQVAESGWCERLDVETLAGVLVAARRAMALPSVQVLKGLALA